MPSYEIRLSVVWVIWCNLLLVATMLLARAIKPEAVVPRFEFAEADTTIIFDYQRGNLIALPVRLDRAVDQDVDVVWGSVEKMPSCLSCVPNEKMGQFRLLTGTKEGDLRLQVDWQKITKPIETELTLLESTGLQLGKQVKHKVKLIPTPKLSFELSQSELREGQDTSVVLKAILSHQIDKDIKIDLSVNDVTNLVALPPSPIVIPAGEPGNAWTITLGNDQVANGVRDVRISFNSIEPTYVEQPAGMFLRIADDERLRILTLQVSSPTNALKEHDSSTNVEITGTLNEPVGDVELNVPLVFEGTATLDQDYKVSSTQLVFKNSAEAKVQLSAISDKIFDRDEFVLVRSANNPLVKDAGEGIQIPILDESKLNLYVKQTPARVLREGTEVSVALALDHAARNVTGAKYPPVRFRLVMPNSEDKDLVQCLEVKGAGLAQKSGADSVYEINWDTSGKPQSFSIAYKDDDEYRGVVPCELVFESTDYVCLNEKQQLLSKSRHALELDDNDSLPLKISLAGKSEEFEGQKVYVLDELTPKESVTLTVEMLQVMNRPVEVPIYFVGRSDSADLVFPKNPALVEIAGQASDRRTVRFAPGQKKLELPIQVYDDEALEGPQVVKIRVDRHATKGQVQLLIKDDDYCHVEISSGPFDILEGMQAQVNIQLPNAPDGIDHEIDLLLESSDKSTASLNGSSPDIELSWAGQEKVRLDPSNIKFPALKREAKLVIKALRDAQEEGEEVLNLRLKLAPAFETGHYRVTQPNLVVRIQEAALQERRILAILVNSRMVRLWPLLGPAFSDFVEQYREQLVGDGLLLVGEKGEAVLWNGADKELPIGPMTSLPTEEMLSAVVTAVGKQPFDQDKAMRLVLFWAAESSDAVVRKLDMPDTMAAQIVIGMPENGQGATLQGNVEAALKLQQAGARHVVDSINPPMRDTTVISVLRKSFKDKP